MLPKPKILAAKISLLAALTVGVPIQTYAGIPVADGINLVQNITTAMEAVSQTLNQIEQYRTQLMQYENQLQNTMAPSSYIWDQAQTTINNQMTAIDTLNYYKTQLGSLDAYLEKYQDIDYYKASPCFSSSAGCSEAEWALLRQVEQIASKSQKKANDAMLRGLDRQQTNLQSDAVRLQQIQSAASGATGQMQAIQYANQFASQQANQLLQIRGLLIAQQNAVAAKMRAEADREAKQQAAAEQLRSGTFRPSPPRSW